MKDRINFINQSSQGIPIDYSRRRLVSMNSNRLHQQRNNSQLEKEDEEFDLAMKRFIFNHGNSSFLHHFSKMNRSSSECSSNSTNCLDDSEYLSSVNNDSGFQEGSFNGDVSRTQDYHNEMLKNLETYMYEKNYLTDYQSSSAVELQGLNETTKINMISNEEENLRNENICVMSVQNQNKDISKSLNNSDHADPCREINSHNPCKMMHRDFSRNIFSFQRPELSQVKRKLNFDNDLTARKRPRFEVPELLYEEIERQVENYNIIGWYCQTCSLGYHDRCEVCVDCGNKTGVFCKKCGKNFKNYKNGHKHEIQVCEPRKLFACRICSLIAKSKRHVKEHISRIHRKKPSIIPVAFKF